MAAVSLELRPRELGPYPLIPNEGPIYVPHEYYQCGDPVWCCHEEPPDENQPVFELIPIRNATEPKVFDGPEGVAVNPELPAYLQNLGFTDRQAKGLAVRFYETSKQTDGFDIGYHDGHGYTDRACDELTYYPVTVYVKTGAKAASTNKTLWHEIGHAVAAQTKDNDAKPAAYHDEKLVQRIKRLGYAAAAASPAAEIAAGTLLSAPEARIPGLAGAILLGAAGLLAVTNPRMILWSLNKEERSCERFARRHKKMSVLVSARD